MFLHVYTHELTEIMHLKTLILPQVCILINIFNFESLVFVLEKINNCPRLINSDDETLRQNI